MSFKEYITESKKVLTGKFAEAEYKKLKKQPKFDMVKAHQDLVNDTMVQIVTDGKDNFVVFFDDNNDVVKFIINPDQKDLKIK